MDDVTLCSEPPVQQVIGSLRSIAGATGSVKGAKSDVTLQYEWAGR